MKLQKVLCPEWDHLLAATIITAITAIASLSTPAQAQATPPTDPQIVEIVEAANKIDIGYAKIALKKSEDKQVRGFAQGMINDHCGATHLDGVKSFMLSKGASILQDRALIGAVANDGDADRVMAVGVRPGSDTEMADFVDLTGNHEMWALAKDQLGIVGTEYTNSGLTQRLEKAGIGFEPCPNGDRYVTQRLEELQAQRLDWRRGGEFTGHLIDTDWGPSGDGVRAAALYAAHAVAEGKTFADLHEELPLWHEEMRKLPVASKAVRDTLLQQPEVSDRLGEIAAAFQGTCRQIVRASGTELAVRAWVESSNPAAAQHASRLIMNTLLRASRAA